MTSRWRLIGLGFKYLDSGKNDQRDDSGVRPGSVFAQTLALRSLSTHPSHIGVNEVVPSAAG